MENINVETAIKKLREYAVCGLSCNARDTTQAAKWAKIVTDALSKQPLNQVDSTGAKSCPLYTDYKKSCQALKDRDLELKRR